MRWVAWVVVVSACAKPSGGTLAPTPAASEASITANAAPSTTAPEAAASASTVPVEARLALPSASAVVGSSSPAPDPRSKLCQVVADGLTLLRPCTGAAGEKPTGTATVSSKRANCLVTVGDLEIIRPCEGKPNERKAPTSKAATPSRKMCERVEHTADGDIVSLRPCPN